MTCPHCGRDKAWRNGHRYGRQRWLCKNCGREYTDKTLNRAASTFLLVAEGEKQAERLVCVQSGTEKGGSVEICLNQNSGLLKAFSEGLKGKIVEFIAKRENDGYKGTKQIVRVLRLLMENGANLYDPESVKEVIKKMAVSDASKHVYCNRYEVFLKFLGGTWEKPKYKGQSKVIYVPTETELDQLIAGLPCKSATFCQIAKDTGASKTEIKKLRWIDIDSERHQIAINETVKGHATRVVSVSQKCIDMINRLPRKGEMIFGDYTIDSIFYTRRQRIAYKLSNPRLLKISLHTFRHWKGTMEYHKTHSLVHVAYILGHKNIQNTMIYIDLEKIVFGTFDDRFHVAIAHNVEEGCKLVEGGFEYVTGEYTDGGKIFRKRK